MSKTIALTGEAFEKEVLDSDMPVLVDFWAPWCQPCIMMEPILDELSEEMGNKLKIAKLNIEEEGNENRATEYMIQSIPNMKLFKNGKIVQEFVGFRSKAILRTELEASLKAISSEQ